MQFDTDMFSDLSSSPLPQKKQPRNNPLQYKIQQHSRDSLLKTSSSNCLPLGTPIKISPTDQSTTSESANFSENEDHTRQSAAELADMENLQILMVSLSLQMMEQGSMPSSPSLFAKLKLYTLNLLGFQEVKMEMETPSSAIRVTFSTMHWHTGDTFQSKIVLAFLSHACYILDQCKIETKSSYRDYLQHENIEDVSLKFSLSHFTSMKNATVNQKASSVNENAQQTSSTAQNELFSNQSKMNQSRSMLTFLIDQSLQNKNQPNKNTNAADIDLIREFLPVVTSLFTTPEEILSSSQTLIHLWLKCIVIILFKVDI